MKWKSEKLKNQFGCKGLAFVSWKTSTCQSPVRTEYFGKLKTQHFKRTINPVGVEHSKHNWLSRQTIKVQLDVNSWTITPFRTTPKRNSILFIIYFRLFAEKLVCDFCYVTIKPVICSAVLLFHLSTLHFTCLIDLLSIFGISANEKSKIKINKNNSLMSIILKR